ncbi:ureidoglycolate hydrolase [Kluyveromyces marxianus]|uniref:Ureidoglycolate hydrolase n=2 Tax=Kluyveromyces marxianus TaxID=4911 RepID=W0T4W6_KLUMD|nr:ureidoglycolate hydrolase [Kluyveromyces marxianus DMKU3-1042]QGN13386.1 ureidoglycolate hydrolase [Kluyveromyces marxianus]BAO38440.1 ureidoglycolate hydrolase [Kluyveromyces marxianus DMKU3-1042]BAP69993.1 ureidoglycolate hydrolase [Kluyveromyces marxianus]
MSFIPLTPLNIKAFQNYGSIISPDEEVEQLDSEQKNANQGTAIKLIKVSSLQNNFPEQYKIKNPNCNLFRCFPKEHMRKNFECVNQDSSETNVVLHELKVLEKHPFSSQTFIPMGRSTSMGFAYIVVVALPNEKGEPDLLTLKAFLCKPNQAVTYGAGVWHAPMIVIGEHPYLDFTVIINELFDIQKPEFDLQERFFDQQLYLRLITRSQ